MPCYVCGELFKKAEKYREWVTWSQGIGSHIVKVHQDCTGLSPDGMNRINNWTPKGKGMIDDGDYPVGEGIIEKDEQTPEAEALYDQLREVWRGD